MLDARTVLIAFTAALAAPLAGAASGQERDPAEDPAPQRLQVDPRQLQQIDPDRLQAVDRSQFQIQDFSQLRPVVPEDRERDPRLAVIDWTAAYTDRREEMVEYGRGFDDATAAQAGAQTGYLPEISRRSANQVRPVHMPVLLPRRGAAVTTRAGGEPGMMVVTRAHFYDASYFEDGVSVHVGGTRLINHRGAAIADAAGLRRGRGADGVRVVTNESGRTADFSRYGAAYTVTVECVSADDPRCRDEQYIRDLVRRLVVAGGNPEGEG